MIAEFFYAGIYGVKADCVMTVTSKDMDWIYEMNQDTAAVCVFLLLCCFMSTFETNNCGDTATIICDVLSCQCFVSVLLFFVHVSNVVSSGLQY